MAILGIDPTPNDALGLVWFDSGKKASEVIQTGERASDQFVVAIQKFVKQRGTGLSGLDGIIVRRGPGPFTGLRVGVAIANAIAYSANTPLVGQAGDDWFEQGVERLKNKDLDKIVEPMYNRDPHIT